MNPVQKARRAFTIGTARIAQSVSRPMVSGERVHNIDIPANLQGYQMTVGSLMSNGASVLQKAGVASHSTLERLVRMDPITFGLIRAVRGIVSQMPWEVVPDVLEHYKELDRWEDQAQDSINKWGYVVEFQSRLLTPEFIKKSSAEISSILKNQKNPQECSHQIAALFRILKRELEQEAIYNCATVRAIFDRPNNHMEKSLRALMELVLNDILVDDAGVIIKNYDDYGNLSELWRAPGHEIYPVMFPDYTVPQPPDAAYVWRRPHAMPAAWFNNSELTYIMQNPQGNGFGMSAVESLMYVITATIMGDTKMIEALKEGSIPPGVINLKDASDAQRNRFQGLLDQQMSRGGGNRIMVVSGVPSEDGTFQWLELPRGVDFQKLQMAEYAKIAPAIKAFVFGFDAEDVRLIAPSASGPAKLDSATVAELSERRAITQMMTIIEEYVNAEIVKQEFKQIKNVRWQYRRNGGVKPDILQQAQSDSVRVAAGLASRNELRDRDGLRPLAGGHIATIATGNAIIPLDVIDGMDFSGLGPENLPGINPDKPDGSTDATGATAPKRNNANDRANMNGHESRG